MNVHIHPNMFHITMIFHSSRQVSDSVAWKLRQHNFIMIVMN